MIDAHQIESCFREIDKLAMPSGLTRVGIGAATGALLAGGSGASRTVSMLNSADALQRRGVITKEEREGLQHRTLTRFGGRLLGGAALGGVAGASAPRALDALKHYSGEAAAHLGRHAARGAAEYAGPAAAAAMHEARKAAPDIGAAAGRAAGREMADEARAAAGTAGRNAAAGAAEGAAKAVGDRMPKWPAKLKDLAKRFVREE